MSTQAPNQTRGSVHAAEASPISRRSRLSCLCYAALAVAFAFAWQAARVHYSYHGNWTGLYATGPKFRVPPALSHENIYLMPNVPGYDIGYDGQFYHYIAHDPFFTRGFAAYIDTPRLRYQRILVPLLAYALALGHQNWIDAGYEAVTLLFLFAGVYWTAACCARAGFHPAWGLLFVSLPAVLVSLRLLTVDTSLAALTAGYALYASEELSWQLLVILLLAPLTRETGIILPIAYGLFSLWHLRIRAAGVVAFCAGVPWLSWLLFVRSRTAPLTVDFVSWPFHGLLHRIVAPPVYFGAPEVAHAGLIADYITLAGLVFALYLTVRLLVHRQTDPLAIACYGFLCVALLAGYSDVWSNTEAFGRTFSPLLLLLPLWGLPRRQWLTLVPLALTFPWDGRRLLVLLFRIAHRV